MKCTALDNIAVSVFVLFYLFYFRNKNQKYSDGEKCWHEVYCAWHGIIRNKDEFSKAGIIGLWLHLTGFNLPRSRT